METKLFPATKALIEFRSKILVIRESKSYADGTQAGNYDTPGGRMQPGEPFDLSLLREVKEETGLDVTIEKPFAVNESRPTVHGELWHIVRIFFICHAHSDEVTLSGDHDDYKWIDPREYKTAQVIDNLYPIFEAYLSQ